MKQALIEMLRLQDEMNGKVHPQWAQQSFAWYRAIWTECAELLEHHGWKWWKKTQPDLPQVQLEVVDIWHFGMSLVLQRSERNVERAAQLLLPGLQAAQPSGDLRASIERVAAIAVAEKNFDAQCFAQLMLDAGLNFETLYRQYIGKNVLNFFRQDHGYKQGIYIKQWAGREDNEHLVEVLDALDGHQAQLRQVIYQALAARYPQV